MSRLDQRIRLKTRRATPSRRQPISARSRSPRSHLVPFVDLKAQYRTVRRAVQAGIRRVLESQQFIEGWGPCEEPCPPACLGDIDGDCFVGITDMLTLLANWG